MPFIPDLWDVVGHGVVTPIAELADATFRDHQRPFRIAIDAAGLYDAYKQNPPIITRPGENYFDRETETAILFRLADLIKRNVCPILVFDGPHAVLRRTFGKPLPLLQEMVKKMGIRCIAARAEAEADCARLENLGYVDAAWSEEGLAVIYGARRVVRETDEPVLENRSSLRTYRVEDEDGQAGSCAWLWRHNAIVYGYLVGGQYGITRLDGLRGCTTDLARSLVRRYREQLQSGYSTSIGGEVTILRRPILNQALLVLAPRLQPSWNFVTPMAIRMFENSRGSSETQLKALFDGNVQSMSAVDEEGLQLFMRRKLNLCKCDYVTRICPALLDSGLQESAHDSLDRPLDFYYGRASVPTAPSNRPIYAYAGLPMDLMIGCSARSASRLDLTDCGNGDCHPGVAWPVPDKFFSSSVLTRVLESLLTATEFETMSALILPRHPAVPIPTANTYSDRYSDDLPNHLLLQGQSVALPPDGYAYSNRSIHELLFNLRQASDDRTSDNQDQLVTGASASSPSIQKADSVESISINGSATSASSAPPTTSDALPSFSTSTSSQPSPDSPFVDLGSASGSLRENADNDRRPTRRFAVGVVIPKDPDLIAKLQDQIAAQAETRRSSIASSDPTCQESEGSASPRSASSDPTWQESEGSASPRSASSDQTWQESEGSASSRSSSADSAVNQHNIRNPANGQYISKQTARELGIPVPPSVSTGSTAGRETSGTTDQSILPPAPVAAAEDRRRADLTSEPVQPPAGVPVATTTPRYDASSDPILQRTPVASLAMRVHRERSSNGEPSYHLALMTGPYREVVDLTLDDDVKEEKPSLSSLLSDVEPPSAAHADFGTIRRDSRAMAGMSRKARGKQRAVNQDYVARRVQDLFHEQFGPDVVVPEQPNPALDSPMPVPSGSQPASGPASRTSRKRPAADQDNDGSNVRRRLPEVPRPQSASAGAPPAVTNDIPASNHFGYSSSSPSGFHPHPRYGLMVGGSVDYSHRLPGSYVPPSFMSQPPTTTSQPETTISQTPTTMPDSQTTMSQPQAFAARMANVETTVTAMETRLETRLTTMMANFTADVMSKMDNFARGRGG